MDRRDFLKKVATVAAVAVPIGAAGLPVRETIDPLFPFWASFSVDDRVSVCAWSDLDRDVLRIVARGVGIDGGACAVGCWVPLQRIRVAVAHTKSRVLTYITPLARDLTEMISDGKAPAHHFGQTVVYVAPVNIYDGTYDPPRLRG